MGAQDDLAFNFFASIGSDFLERFGTLIFFDGCFRDKFLVLSTWVIHSEASLIKFNCTKFKYSLGHHKVTNVAQLCC